MASLADHRLVIACPLQYELKALRREGLDTSCKLLCCGPGSAGIGKLAGLLGAGPQCIVLAGVAGSLSPELQEGEAVFINEVVEDGTNERWRPSLGLPNRSNVRIATSTSTVNSVSNKAGRHSLHIRTGADVVDHESVAFARWAAAAGHNWAVVRGISDGFKTVLPPDIDQWVKPDGSTSHLAVTRFVARSPHRVPGLLHLAKSARRAMARVAQVVLELANACNRIDDDRWHP